MITIDGVVWSVPCDITREAEVRPSEISGLMLDRSWFNDVIGTYMSYTVSIAVPVTLRDLYEQIYEILTGPVDGHAFMLPYNNGQIAVTGRVQGVKDELVRFPGDVNHWKGIVFTIISNAPTKYYTLGELLARGRSPLPEIAAVQEGDIYTYTSTGWVKTNYADADSRYY